MATVDERYAEKILARKEGRAPVIVQVPPEALKGNSPEAIEARYQAKLRARLAPPKPEGDAAKASAEKPPKGGKPPEPKPEGDAAKK
jgi:hypothetical protein